MIKPASIRPQGYAYIISIAAECLVNPSLCLVEKRDGKKRVVGLFVLGHETNLQQHAAHFQ
jgi:hypothetical protein